MTLVQEKLDLKNRREENMDTQLFDQKVKDNGVKYKFIAEKLGISEQALTQKRKGNIPFKVCEINILKDVLRLTNSERDRIFL